MVGWNTAPTVGSFVLFQFYFTMRDGIYRVEQTILLYSIKPVAHHETRTPEIKPTTGSIV